LFLTNFSLILGQSNFGKSKFGEPNQFYVLGPLN